MTREELKKHCQKQIENCEKFGRYNENFYEEHKLILELLEQEPCEDAISRQAVKEQMIKYGFHAPDMTVTEFVEDLLLVKPQEPKIGHWIMIDKELQRYICSECGEVIKLYKKSEISKLEKDETLSDYPFSHCGAKMVEP